jgi:hypothetical protein
MKRDIIIYRSTLGLITFVMLFSIYKMFSPEYEHLGFPGYFRIELTVMKILGLAALLIPGLPVAVKDWAYAGFSIVLISASIAHSNSGDTFLLAINPLFYLAIVIVSNYYMHKLKKSEQFNSKQVYS